MEYGTRFKGGWGNSGTQNDMSKIGRQAAIGLSLGVSVGMVVGAAIGLGRDQR